MAEYIPKGDRSVHSIGEYVPGSYVKPEFKSEAREFFSPHGRVNMKKDITEDPIGTLMGVFESATPGADASDLNSKSPTGFRKPTPTGKKVGESTLALLGGNKLGTVGKNIARSKIDDVVFKEANKVGDVINSNLTGKGLQKVSEILTPPSIKIIDKFTLGKAGQLYKDTLGKITNEITNRLGYSAPKARAITNDVYRDTLDNFGVKTIKGLKKDKVEDFWDAVADGVNSRVYEGISKSGTAIPGTTGTALGAIVGSQNEN
jgi:hypothetical protein